MSQKKKLEGKGLPEKGSEEGVHNDVEIEEEEFKDMETIRKEIMDAVFIVVKGFYEQIEAFRFQLMTVQNIVKKIYKKMQKMEFQIDNLTDIWTEDSKRLRCIQEKFATYKEGRNLKDFFLEISSSLNKIAIESEKKNNSLNKIDK